MRTPLNPTHSRPTEHFFTPAEVATRFRLSLRTIRRWIATEELPVMRFGRAVRISESDLARFLDRARQG